MWLASGSHMLGRLSPQVLHLSPSCVTSPASSRPATPTPHSSSRVPTPQGSVAPSPARPPRASASVSSRSRSHRGRWAYRWPRERRRPSQLGLSPSLLTFSRLSSLISCVASLPTPSCSTASSRGQPLPPRSLASGGTRSSARGASRSRCSVLSCSTTHRMASRPTQSRSSFLASLTPCGSPG